MMIGSHTQRMSAVSTRIASGFRGSSQRRVCPRKFVNLSAFTTGLIVCAAASQSMGSEDLRRADGVRILHDPYAPGIAEKYGTPGNTDNEGFDPYSDSVGPGIYGGIVKRDASGEIVIGRQYQNHNTRPGPVYAGGGYTPMSNAIHEGVDSVALLLEKFPDLVNDISTGGATPLHVCGMSRRGELATEFIINQGADLDAIDSYGYKPLHRMASNNLAIGTEAMLIAGADPNAETLSGQTPLSIALQADARESAAILRKFGGKDLVY